MQVVISDWISNNWIEIFGAVTGILYVFLEVRQNLWLWPVGIVTSAVYIWVFFTGKLYADMSLQGYYLVISIIGWYWWVRGKEGGQGVKRRSSVAAEGGEGEKRVMGEGVKGRLTVSRLRLRTGVVLACLFVLIFTGMWQILDRLTDSPVPAWDSFITSLSVVATWMLARKIYEHWFLWIVVNISAAILFFTRGLYPTVILYMVYCVMSFAGLAEWKKSLK